MIIFKMLNWELYNIKIENTVTKVLVIKLKGQLPFVTIFMKGDIIKNES